MTTAMIQVSRLVGAEKFYYTAPQPRRRIERLRPVARQVGCPHAAFLNRHLSAMRMADDTCQIPRDRTGLAVRHSINIDLKVLRHHFTDDDTCSCEVPCDHAPAKIG